ncbi:MAG: matrixin family metalloprotease [Myxococcota bacterium]
MNALRWLLLLCLTVFLGCDEPATDASPVDAVTDSASSVQDAGAELDAAVVDDTGEWGDAAAPEPADAPDVMGDDAASGDADELEALDVETVLDEEVIDEAAGLPMWPPVSVLPVPAPPWFHQVRLNDIALDDNGESDDLFIELPEETSSVFVMVRGEESAFLTLKKAITPPPLSESIVKGPGDHVCVPCKNRVASAQHIGSFLLPNDPDVEVKGGEWTFKVRATHRVEDITQGLVFLGYPSTCQVTVLARTEPVPDTAILPIRLHFTGSHGLTAESAPTDERLQTALDILTAIYATAGVGVEIAGYHDVPGVDEDPTLTDVGSTAGFPNDLSKLFLAGQADDPTALNVFFVNSIYKDVDYEEVGGIVLGIAGGVPGPAYLGPSYRSGVAIATFEISEDDHLGNVMAHEVGHYLGLFHSTEKDAIFHDTLQDTAESDGGNLMFWGWSADQMALSESQSYVLRSHPMVMPDEE